MMPSTINLVRKMIRDFRQSTGRAPEEISLRSDVYDGLWAECKSFLLTLPDPASGRHDAEFEGVRIMRLNDL